MRTPADPRKASSRRLGSIAFSATCVAAYMLTLVYHDAAKPLPGDPAAQLMAQSALNELGYDWAQAKMSGNTVLIEGTAPRDAERVIAYVAVHRALRPFMGKDRHIEGVVSHITTRDEQPADPAADQSKQPRTIEAADLVPPPAPRVHRGATGSVSEETDGTAAAPEAGAAEDQTQTPAAHFEPSSGDAQAEADAAPPADAPDTDAASSTGAAKAPEQRADLPAVRADIAASAPPEPVEVAAVETLAERTALPEAAEPPSPPRNDPVGDLAPGTTPVAEPAQTAAVSAPPTAVAEPPALAPPPAPPAPAPSVAAAIETPAQTAQAVTPTAADRCKVQFAEALSASAIVFGRDSASIEKESRPLLDKLAAIAKRCSQFRFTVAGHTDLTGSSAHNLALSQKRAEAVRWALIDRGIDMDHISAVGHGATRPLELGTSDMANAKNRRIEVTVQEPAPRGARTAGNR